MRTLTILVAVRERDSLPCSDLIRRMTTVSSGDPNVASVTRASPVNGRQSLLDSDLIALPPPVPDARLLLPSSMFLCHKEAVFP